MSIVSHDALYEQKAAWLQAKLATLLNGHGFATFQVHRFITKAMLGMESNYDFKAVFGSPVAWCRLAPVDLEYDTDRTSEEVDIGGSTVMLAHTFSVLIQYQFNESNVFAGSTAEQFTQLLYGKSPAGVLYELATLGAEVVEDEVIVQVEPPDSIAIPEFPVAIYGAEEETHVHHCDFRVTLI